MKNFFQKKTWQMEKQKQKDEDLWEKKKKKSESKIKEVLSRSVKLWLKTSFLRFSVWKQHLDCLEKMAFACFETK